MFDVQCNNKGCGKLQSPYLDKETDEVICAECGKTITNVSKFFKTQLRAFGQIKRTVKAQKAFSVKCKNCKTDGQPELAEDKKTLFCSKCKNIFGPDDINRPFRQAILEYLRTVIDPDSPKIKIPNFARK